MEAVQDPFEVVAGDRAETVLDERRSCHAAIVRLHGFDLDDTPCVVGVAGAERELIAARTTIPLTMQHVGSDVLVVFDRGDLRRPVITGVLQESGTSGPAQAVTVAVDDSKLVLSAEREVTLRCGDASITLTRAGKVLIRGRYVLTHSTGVNKIKGAAVEIN